MTDTTQIIFNFPTTERTNDTMENENENEQDMTTCESCAGDFDDSEITCVGNNDAICDDCLSEHYVMTTSGAHILIDDSVTMSCGNVEHMHDVYMCCACDDYVYDINSTYNDGVICEYCLEQEYVYCVDIDNWILNGDAYWSDASGEHYYECPDDENETGPVYLYDFNIFDKYGVIAIVNNNKVAISKHLVFGVELETDSRRGETVGSISNAIENTIEGWAICKEDSTVSGPEIVSLPACLESHRVIGWQKVCDILRPIAKGYHGASNGMHVHINSAAIGELTLGKMLVFINDENNHALLGLIAQRKFWENNYCDAKSSNFNSVGKAGKNPRFTKFSALNVTGNGTAEMRIFKSTLMPDRILKNVEFCHALVKFCDQQSARELTAKAFSAYVSTHAPTYKNLSNFISQREEA